MGSAIVKEIALCHYDVQPYRDAFHRRNRPCHLLCFAFLLLFALTIVSGLMLSSSSDLSTSPVMDTLLNDLLKLTELNRSTILTDTKNIFAPDLQLTVTHNRITANKQFPLCFAAPHFLMPLLQTQSKDTIQSNDNTDIDSIRKSYYDMSEDFLLNKDWLKPPSFFGDDNAHKNNDMSEDPFADMRIEDLWKSLIGYELDPQCFIRIDQSSNEILRKMESANVEPSERQQMMCSSKHNVL